LGTPILAVENDSNGFYVIRFETYGYQDSYARVYVVPRWESFKTSQEMQDAVLSFKVGSTWYTGVSRNVDIVRFLAPTWARVLSGWDNSVDCYPIYASSLGAGTIPHYSVLGVIENLHHNDDGYGEAWAEYTVVAGIGGSDETGGQLSPHDIDPSFDNRDDFQMYVLIQPTAYQNYEIPGLNILGRYEGCVVDSVTFSGLAHTLRPSHNLEVGFERQRIYYETQAKAYLDLITNDDWELTVGVSFPPGIGFEFSPDGSVKISTPIVSIGVNLPFHNLHGEEGAYEREIAIDAFYLRKPFDESNFILYGESGGYVQGIRIGGLEEFIDSPKVSVIDINITIEFRSVFKWMEGEAPVWVEHFVPASVKLGFRFILMEQGDNIDLDYIYWRAYHNY